MKLKRLRIRNFRCFRDEVSIDFQDITALIGKNDSGKSSIMEALDLFLNDFDPDKDDASKEGNANELTIICHFSDLPNEVVIDDAAPTNLAAEFLLNPDGDLEIHKKYSGHLQKPKCTSIEALALHPKEEPLKNLLQLKNPALKQHAAKLGIDLTGVDSKVNAQVRARIRVQVVPLDLEITKIPLNEENGKKIWDELKKYLPSFSLFKSDRPSSDQDPEAQDPLKTAVREALKSKEAELNAITDYVKSEVQKIADSTLEKLREMDPNLASELKPTFAQLKWDTLFKASITSDDDIPINKRGSGVKRLILLNFFRAKSEQLARQSGRTSLIYAVEEPETSQHPNNQRMLFRALSDLSSEAQVIISTHTPMLARSLPDSALRYIHVRDDGTREIMYGGPQTNAVLTKSLGVLPDNNVKLFICVEGPTDIAFLQSISRALLDGGLPVPDLEKLELDGELIFAPLGGSTLALWSSRLAGLNRPEFHLCDRDFPPPEQARYHRHVTDVNHRQQCRARSTAKKEIENYLHREAIVEAYAGFNINLQIAANLGPFQDVPAEIARLVHEGSASQKTWGEVSPEDKKEKESKAKRVLCAVAARKMTPVRLAEIDPDNDLLGWFQDMSQLLQIQ